MSEISLSINGRSYLVACEEGQEDHLQKLGAFVDEKMRDLSAKIGTVGDARLLVMTALLLSDELFEAKQRLAHGNGEVGDIAELEEAEATMAEALDAFAERIEAIAARLDGA